MLYISGENFKYMRYIANILTDKNFKEKGLYNIVSSKKELIDGIPTLVIGWEFTKKMYNDANILDWEISRDVYWTYGNREKRNRYDENINKFKDLALLKFIKSVKYEYKNILLLTDEEKNEIIEIITGNGVNVYIHNDMLYVLKDNKNVIGLSLRDIDYIGKDRKKILSKVFRNEKNHIISLTDSELSYDIKNTLYKYSYVVPYLFDR